MGTAFAYILAIVAFVIVLNFVMLMFRLRRDSYKKPSRDALEEEKAVVLRNNEIRRRLGREEDDAAQQVELRNKTLALYDEVRRRAAAREKAEAVSAAAAAAAIDSKSEFLDSVVNAEDLETEDN